MMGFVILTTRKRVVVALAHTAVFLGVAMLGLLNAVRPLGRHSSAGPWALAGIYFIVTSVLLVLLAVAGRSEKLYFGLCASSAAFGLARQIAGDPRMHVAVYARIGLLGSAVLVGLALLRRYRAATGSAAVAAGSGSELR